ncbi:MAG TPA: hypothetical protein VM821_06085 [Abditibacteriaceae bacterium]|nr:hypothetical protein [Abditibacteriaceae bacterium]
MFRKKSVAIELVVEASAPRGRFPTFRRLARGLLGRLGRLPFLSRAWWKRNKRRVAAACLTFAAIWTATNIYASVLLNRELEAIRKRGEPLTMAELAPPPIPDAQNAAILYRRADATLKKLGLTQEEEIQMMGQDPKTNAALSAPQLSATRRGLLQKYRPAIELIRQASRLSSCRFPTQWQKPAFAILFPDLPSLRQFARLMSASATQQAQDGKTAQAVEDVGAIYRISEHAASDPIVISLLVSNAIENIGHDALAQVFKYSNLTPAQKSSVETILPRVDKEQQLARALQGERAFGLSGFNSINSTSEEPGAVADFPGNAENGNTMFSPLAHIARVLWLPMFKLDEVWFLRTHPANVSPAPVEDAPNYAMLTKIVVPVFSRTHETIRKSQTLRDLARVALDLNVYHTQAKTYPANLAQLETQTKTKFPLDRFSGKPFVYRGTKSFYVLYSIGPNKTDDNGRTEADRRRAPAKVQRLPSGSWPAALWDDITWPPRKRRP